MMRRSRLPILIYHRFSESQDDRLTVSRRTFERQLRYLEDRGFRSVRLSELARLDDTGQERRVGITIDDAYASVADIAVPVLARYGFSATCFVPVGLIGAENEWDGGGVPLMSADTLRALPREHIELALHSWSHDDYRTKSGDEIARDVIACRRRLDALDIPYVPALAYPYGKVPKNARTREEWNRALRASGIEIACRVGHRLNRLPLRDALMVTRTNVHGDEALWKFRVKVALGRSKLF